MRTFNLPDLGEGLAEAEIVRWHVQPGDPISIDQPMLAVETAKAIVEVPSPFTGRIKATHGNPGDFVATGALLVEFEGDAAPDTGHAGEDAGTAPQAMHASTDSGTVVGRMPASDDDFADVLMGRPGSAQHSRAVPAARALAKQLNIDLTQIRGTGRGGVVTLEDVLSSTSFPASAPALPLPQGAGESEPLRGLRRAMSQSMALSRDNVMGCTIFDDADLHEWADDQDLTVRLLRAIVAGCTAERGLNAWFDGVTQSRRLLTQIDVAVAVDTPAGLMAPVIRDVGSHSVAQLRQDVDRLKRSAGTRTVNAQELRDFTFMLSNFGMIAGRYATPVVVPPAVAILGCGRLCQDVVAVKGNIEAHPRVPLSLTFDHRCVTGGEAARFLAALIRDLQKGN